MLSTYDFHLPKQQFLHVIQWLTPTVTFMETSSEKSAICCAETNLLAGAGLFPPFLPAQVWQWYLHPWKGLEGWLKIRVTFFFDMSKSFIFSFPQDYFSSTLQWKMALIVLFSFFFFHLASLLLPLYVELSYIIKFST